jgi:1,4-dihydroxy-2-naphthoyl-CoA hydrolase
MAVQPDPPPQLRDLMPFAATLGVELLEVGPDTVQGRLDHSPALCTTGGVLHGGVLMALADSCGAVCAFLNMPEGAIGTATLESKTNFLRGVTSGQVIATSKPLHRGRTQIVVETELTRDDGKLAAKTTQTQTFSYSS